jgi:hypothetical protein
MTCRRYCTARLRRLYKSLKFLHGRGKYTKRNITESTVTDGGVMLSADNLLYSLVSLFILQYPGVVFPFSKLKEVTISYFIA